MGGCIRRVGDHAHVANEKGEHDNGISESSSESSEAESEDCNIELESWSSYRTKGQLLSTITIFEIDDYISWCRDWGYPWVKWDESIGEEVYFLTNKEAEYYNSSDRFWYR